MKILIFTEGTILMHNSGIVPNKGKVDWKKFSKRDPSIHDYASYKPVKKAVEKIKKWKDQGAEILYLTSRTKPDEIQAIKNVLKKYDFPKGKLLFCKKDEEYEKVVEKIIPDVLIEDDCESIGGTDELTITHVKPQIKTKIKSIVIPEFGGIDHLLNDIEKLKL